MRDAFVQRLTELAESDSRIFLITADLGFGVLTKFADRLPAQFLNVGVAEQNMIGVATGLALEGRIVFTYSIGNFATLRCLEQIRNDVCYHDANVKIVAMGGGFSYGALGISHHATEDITILRALPNMRVVCPGDAWETAEAIGTLVETDGPFYLRIDRSATGASSSGNGAFVLGRARTVREGKDATLVVTGAMLATVLAAADTLEAEGTKCRVLSMHTVKPIDASAILAAAAETGAIVTIEEHTLSGGLGGAVAEVLLDEGVSPAMFRRLGLQGCFSSIVGSQEYLRGRYGLDAESIASSVRQVLDHSDQQRGK